MPNAEKQGPRPAIRYRTIRIGKGRTRRVLHIAIVRKRRPAAPAPATGT